MNSNFSSFSKKSLLKNKESNDSNQYVLADKRKFSSIIFDDLENFASTKLYTLSDSFPFINKNDILDKFNNEHCKISLSPNNKTINYKNDNPSINQKIKNNIDDFISNNNNVIVNAKLKSEIIDNLNYMNKKNYFSSNLSQKERLDLNHFSCLDSDRKKSSLYLNLNSDINLNEKSNYELNSNRDKSNYIIFFIK
jgi:hypothetical protein